MKNDLLIMKIFDFVLIKYYNLWFFIIYLNPAKTLVTAKHCTLIKTLCKEILYLFFDVNHKR